MIQKGFEVSVLSGSMLIDCLLCALVDTLLLRTFIKS